MKNISQHTMDFYDNISASWDKTRQSKWSGWDRMWQLQEESIGNDELNILDFGCGNGRLLQYYMDKVEPLGLRLNYLGLDISRKLIGIAREKFAEVGKHKVRFVVADLTNTDEVRAILAKKDGKFDLVTIIAVLHHLTDQDARKSLIEMACGYLKAKGILTYTTWEFMSDAKTKNLIVRSGENSGDYFLGWQGNDHIRFVHDFSEQEKQELASVKGFELVSDFYADGRNAKLNHYFMLKKDAEKN